MVTATKTNAICPSRRRATSLHPFRVTRKGRQNAEQTAARPAVKEFAKPRDALSTPEEIANALTEVVLCMMRHTSGIARKEMTRARRRFERRGAMALPQERGNDVGIAVSDFSDGGLVSGKNQ